MSHVAEFNLAKLRAPLDHESNAEFVRALEPINALAEATPGFVWRLTTDEGSSSYATVPGLEDPLVIVNYSIWTDVESLRHFVLRSGHAMYLRRRRDWFESMDGPTTVCWWIRPGERPAPEEGLARLRHLAEFGASPRGWPLSDPVPDPDAEQPSRP